jgi:hypothetical protein
MRPVKKQRRNMTPTAGIRCYSRSHHDCRAVNLYNPVASLLDLRYNICPGKNNVRMRVANA